MLHKLLKTIDRYDMIGSGDNIVVGVSGGADSVALLHMLYSLRYRLNIKLFVAHINHGLRGQDADMDADYVRKICREWDVPFFLDEVDIKALSKSHSLSEEEVGRKARYDFYEKVLLKVDGNKIALGHHRDDQIETILYNIIRGTGMEGLQGIKPVRDGKIIRPLLEFDRLSIERYLKKHDIVYRHDRTNYQTIYTRNKIRLELIPYIERTLNQGFKDSIIRMTDILGEEDDFLKKYTEKLMEKNLDMNANQITISIDFLQSCHQAIKRRIIRRCVEHLFGSMSDIGKVHIDSIINMERLPIGSIIDLPWDLKVYRDYDDILLIRGKMHREKGICAKLEVPSTVILDKHKMAIRAKHVAKWCFGATDCVYIDGDAIIGPLHIRNRKDGDRFKPLGMQGSKKLKDFFIDEKVPRYIRDSIPLVVDGENIIWVVGYQIGDDYKISKDTENVIELSYINIKR